MDTRSLIPLLLLTVLCCACSPLRRLPATPRSAEAATGSVNAQETAQTKAPEAGLTAVRILEQVALSIPAGQYSGITWLRGKRYAVVHDKLNGGGIVFFDIEMDLATGAIGAVSVSIPDITRLSAIAGMDNEGIAFADGKLYVSAESDQSIREYGLDGAPTGRSLAVPEKLGRSNITANAGFESLTWSPATRLFWTTTEKP
ncbi:MAG: esterase-like activity of phytase family protein, partial [Bacteroidales bacterium]|nr:esterase-like activity of phytase family protein [Bacteroidales bacterium]